MPEQRKIFRIEQMGKPTQPSALTEERDEAYWQHEILNEIKALRDLVAQAQQPLQSQPASAPAAAPEGVSVQKQMNGEARKLKIELDVIGQAIQQTKQEIVTLQDQGFDGAQVARVAHQLDAVVAGTEQATRKILKAAEDIDQMAATLLATLKGNHEQGIAQDIQEQVTQIFEACNFHDLTGQRITKVSVTMKLIEDHIARMTEIWTVIERFGADAARPKNEAEDADLLAGPKLEGDAGHSSQDDIDAMFH